MRVSRKWGKTFGGNGQHQRTWPGSRTAGRLGHGVEAGAGAFEAALFGQFFPDGFGEFFGGGDADDGGAAAGEGAFADAGFVVEAG